jgi:hypothetical protein
MASDPDVDAVCGDWLAEMTMVMHGSGKQKNLANGSKVQVLPLEERKKGAMYAETFLQCFEPSIEYLVKNGTKMAVNAGASDTELLAEVVVDMLEKKGAGHLKVSWISGDEVTPQVRDLIKKGEKFESLQKNMQLEQLGLDPIVMKLRSQSHSSSCRTKKPTLQSLALSPLCARVSMSHIAQAWTAAHPASNNIAQWCSYCLTEGFERHWIRSFV